MSVYFLYSILASWQEGERGGGQGGEGRDHKVLINVEYRAVSGVFPAIDPSPSPPSKCVLPTFKKPGGCTLAGRRGGGGVNIFASDFGVSHRSESCEIRLFFASKQNKIFASISNFAKVRAHPSGG